MELNKYLLKHYSPVFSQAAPFEETADIIVPDAYGDIAKIVGSFAVPTIKDKDISSGKVTITGSIKCAMLYIPENSAAIVKLDTTIPFSQSFESPAINEDSKVLAKITLINSDAKELNSRKIAVRANLLLYVRAQNQTVTELCQSIDADEKVCLQTLENTHDLTLAVAVNEKDFSFSDELVIPSEKPAIREIISTKTALNVTDVKGVGNKSIFKGQAEVQVLYLSDALDKIESVSTQIPFSQIIDIDNTSEQADCEVSVLLKSLEAEVRPDLNGQSKSVYLTVFAGATAVTHTSTSVKTVEDCYSAAYSLEAEIAAQTLPSITDKIKKSTGLRELIEVVNDPAAIIDHAISLESVGMSRDENGANMQYDVFANILFRGMDDTYYSVFRKIPVVVNMDIGQNSAVEQNAWIESVYCSIMGNKINLEAQLAVEAKLSAEVSIKTVTSANVDLKDYKLNAKRPSIILRQINKPEALWDIAKNYNTTITEIMAANNLEDEERVPAGRMLLIPKRR